MIDVDKLAEELAEELLNSDAVRAVAQVYRRKAAALLALAWSLDEWADLLERRDVPREAGDA